MTNLPQTNEPGTPAQPNPDPAAQPSPYSQPAGSETSSSTSTSSSSSSPDFVTRSEFEDRVGKLEKERDDAVEVRSPQPDPEVTAATAAAMGQPDPEIFDEDNNPPEGFVDPHGRSDGTGLATEGNEPVPEEKRAFFHGF